MAHTRPASDRRSDHGDAAADPLVDLRTARRLLEDQMQEIGHLGELVRERSRQLDQFAHVASHDLKAPLRRITLYMSRLQEQLGEDLPEDAAESMAAIERAVNRMRSLIDDLLDYSRVGSQPLAPEPIDAAACIEEVLEDLELPITTSGCQIEVGELPPVRADPVRLRQVLQNLVANAIKHHGDTPPRIRIHGTRRDGTVRISVSDDGIGIDPEHHDRIFELFTRLQPASETDGNGVGLAICKRIAERHGGRIELESAPGAGATFTLVLPEQQDTA